MANKQAYPNTVIVYTVQIYIGGMPATGILSAATLTIEGGSPIAMSVSGMDLLATIPNTQAIGDDQTFVVQWTQLVDGVTSTQSATYLVDIIAQPPTSSQSYVPANITRQCLRLCEPADTTDEQIILSRGQHLQIYCTPPYSILRAIAANLPSSGPDLLSMSYTDASGQPGQLSINCQLWMSDNSYLLVSADNGWQYAISSVNAVFFDNYAVLINTRNATAGALPIMPCANASRYDWPVLLPNQAIPGVFIYDGVLISSSTSSTPNVI